MCNRSLSVYTHVGCSVDPCLAYQTLSLSRVVWAVCSSPEGVELGQLTDMLLSAPTHPQQLAAFKLAERWVTVVVSCYCNYALQYCTEYLHCVFLFILVCYYYM